MSRRAARVTLAVLGLAILVGLWLTPVTPAHQTWPAPHHTNVLVFGTILLAWAILVLTAVIFVVGTIVKLWEWAEL